MRNKISHIAIGCCAVFFCAASAFGQGWAECTIPGTGKYGCKGKEYDEHTSAALSSESSIGYITCSGDLLKAHPIGNQPLVTESSDSGCVNFYANVRKYGQNQEYQMEYDSARKLIETCYYTKFAEDVFQDADEGLYYIHLDDTTLYQKYRQWLISVLFLNRTDPFYFCACMRSIAGTYTYEDHNLYPNAGSSICKWMIDHHQCTMYKWVAIDSESFAANRREWVGSGDSSKGIPFDSSYNTMDQLGLGFLDTLQLIVSPSKPLSPIYLYSFTVVPNPSHGLVSSNYTLARQGFVQFSVYDELGRLIWNRAGESETEGMHELPIDLRSSPSGTYYVRIEAGFGEVKTVKLVYEK